VRGKNSRETYGATVVVVVVATGPRLVNVKSTRPSRPAVKTIRNIPLSLTDENVMGIERNPSK
jgi:hypothetical protein